jgi:predicted nucleotidyltransferase
MMISKKIIREATKRIAEQFHPQRIILFGSYARGTADTKSDVDLLVISPLRKKRRTLILEMNRSLWGLGLARDIIILTPKEFEIEKEIPGTIARCAFKEGKLLYEQNTKNTQNRKAG